MISMFDQQVLIDAFEANFAAQQKAGIGHLPCWLAPFHEKDRGVRGTGDGFGDKALWHEPLATARPATVVQPRQFAAEASPLISSVRSLTIAEAKEGLARTFGVSPDAIEITIRG
jgi:hypothetical protein